MSIFKQAFETLDADVPNVGSWKRRIATALNPGVDTHGSWAKRAVAGIEDDLGPGSWTAKLRRAIKLDLLTSGGGEPTPTGDARLLEDGTSYRLLEDGSFRLLEA